MVYGATRQLCLPFCQTWTSLQHLRRTWRRSLQSVTAQVTKKTILPQVFLPCQAHTNPQCRHRSTPRCVRSWLRRHDQICHGDCMETVKRIQLPRLAHQIALRPAAVLILAAVTTTEVLD